MHDCKQREAWVNTPNRLLSFKIRRAMPKDAEQVISGINAVCAEGGSFYTRRFVSTSQWDAVLYYPDSLPDHMLAVADWNGQFLGAARLFPGGEHTLYRHVAELGMFVTKPFRRQGVGTQLLNFLKQWALQNKIEKITLSVFSTNVPAIHFFEKHGFEREGVLSRQIKTGDHYADFVLMRWFLE